MADLDLSQLSELFHWAPSFKPTTNQLSLDAICKLPKEMTEFAAENNIQLLSHGDDMELTSKANVQRILRGFKGLSILDSRQGLSHRSRATSVASEY